MLQKGFLIYVFSTLYSKKIFLGVFLYVCCEGFSAIYLESSSEVE